MIRNKTIRRIRRLSGILMLLGWIGLFGHFIAPEFFDLPQNAFIVLGTGAVLFTLTKFWEVP